MEQLVELSYLGTVQKFIARILTYQTLSPIEKALKNWRRQYIFTSVPSLGVRRAGSSCQAGGASAQRGAGLGAAGPTAAPAVPWADSAATPAHRNACVHFRRDVSFWRRIKTFSLQRILTTNLCMKSQYQIPQAQPRTAQNQALAGSMALGPFSRISRTQAGGRGGSIPAIPELQVLWNWEFSREEKGTI